MSSAKIRVRFAPSPTGPLHIGGVRTALFNFLFARHEGGEFLLRIEDTDRERSRPEFEKEILDSLKWLKLNWDGEVVRQSERLDRYRQYAEELIEKGAAYRFEGSVKFSIPKTKVQFHDSVFGMIEFDSATFDDFVILKSNGFPAYNFACVVDDHELGISHLFRGADHISNTPRQVLLYRALRWEHPFFGHLPLVLGKDGEPLSKRHGEVNLMYYRDEGFIPDGILNYLALLGWSGGGNREIYSREELIASFSVKKVKPANATFDLEKMKWLNGEHLRALTDEAFVQIGREYLRSRDQNLALLSDSLEREVLLLFKLRARTLRDLFDQSACFYGDPVFDPEAVSRHLGKKESRELLARFSEALQGTKDFQAEGEWESFLRSFAAAASIEAKALIHPARVALTGKSVSPGLFSVMRILGKEKVVERLRHAVQGFENAGGAP